MVNNHRPLSLLSRVSKILVERLVFDQVYPVVNPLICIVKSISKAHCYMKFEYHVNDQSLARVDSMIDLVVTLTSNMTSKHHI